MISWEWFKLAGIIGLCVVGWWIYKDIKQAKDKQKSIIIWAIVAVLMAGVFWGVNSHRDYLLVKFFPAYYQTELGETPLKIEEIFKP